MNRRTILFLCLTLFLILGCSKTRVPPRIDLGDYGAIGLVDFTSNAEGNLDRYATQKFLEIVGESQPKARFMELGSQEKLLESEGLEEMDELDHVAVKTIGKMHNLNAIILGSLDVGDIEPKLRFSIDFFPMSVQAEVDAWMKAKLVDTKDGATVWTASARDKKTVAHVSVFSSGRFVFDAEDPDEAYGDLVESLVKEVSEDLRVTYR